MPPRPLRMGDRAPDHPDPRRDQARRRPVRLRPEQGPPGGASRRSPRCRRPPTWAPRTGRRRSGTRWPGCAAASPSSSPCPTATRWSSSNGGTTAFWEVADVRADPRPGAVRRASASSAPSSPRRSRTRRSWASRPCARPSPAAPPAFLVAEAGVDAYATPHNETSTGVAVPVRRVAGADEGALLLVDATSGGRRPRRRRRARPTSTTSPRRRCFGSDGGLWLALMSPAALDRADRDQGVRPLHPGVPRPGHRDRAARGWSRPTTPRRWPPSSWPPSRSTG